MITKFDEEKLRRIRYTQNFDEQRFEELIVDFIGEMLSEGLVGKILMTC